MSEGFIEQPVGEEVVIFDSKTKECHALSKEARTILENERSALTPQESAEKFQREFPSLAGVAERLVSDVLDELAKRRLIKKQPTYLPRRAVLKVAGITLISSIIGPTPAAAQSAGALVLTSAVYSGPDSTNCPGPNKGPGSANVLACLQSFQSPTSISGTTLPGGCGPTLGTGDPASGTRKSLIINYTCGGVSQPQSITCDGDPFSINC